MPRVILEDVTGRTDTPIAPPLNSSQPTYATSAPVVAAAPTPGQGIQLTASGTLPTTAAATAIQLLTADPASPVIGQMWYRVDTNQLSVRVDSATTKRVTLA